MVMKKFFLLLIGAILVFSPRAQKLTLDKDIKATDKPKAKITYYVAGIEMPQTLKEEDSLRHFPFYMKLAFEGCKSFVSQKFVKAKSGLSALNDRCRSYRSITKFNEFCDQSKEYIKFIKNIKNFSWLGIGYDYLASTIYHKLGIWVPHILDWMAIQRFLTEVVLV